MKRGDPIRIVGALWLAGCLFAAFFVREGQAVIVAGVIGFAVLWAAAGAREQREPDSRPGFPAEARHRATVGQLRNHLDGEE